MDRVKKSLAIIILVLFDQVFKQLAVANAEPGGLFTLVYNSGAIFGIMPGKNTLMIAVSVVAILVVGYYWFKGKGLEGIAYSLIIAGILGNLLDRILIGAVVDYVSIGSWPVFNMADSMIVIGVGYLVVDEIRIIYKELRNRFLKRS